jgi:uncharacterized repeat protein (TIGR01451 family)
VFAKASTISLRTAGLLLFLVLLLISTGIKAASAQENSLTVTGIEPAQVVSGPGSTLTIHGSNFTAATAVNLAGVGALPISYFDSGTLVATLPADLPVGQFDIEVNDPVNGSVLLTGALDVLAPTATPTATNTATATPTVTPTATNTATATPTATPTATQVLPINVTRSEPSRITSGQEGILSVFGANFTQATTVRLVGVGLLSTTYVNSGALTATLPSSLTPGQYGIEVSDPIGGTVTLPTPLTVVALPEPTALPTPTREPTPTSPPPTPVPGQPSLIVRSFRAEPPAVQPEDTVRFTFEVFNQGTHTAQGIAISLEPGGDFVPASGQGSVVLPDLNPGAVHTAALSVIATRNVPAGPVNVPISMTYRDSEGQIYTSSADLSVNVREATRASQLSLDTYTVDPDPVQPGQPVNLTVTVSNTGNQVASQVMLRVTGTDGVLLAGPEGDTFPLGDLGPGTSTRWTLPLVVAMAAEAGPQAQPVSISYLQAGETKQVDDSITVNIADTETGKALLLLESYSADTEVLKPGDEFTLDVTIQNVGDGGAADLIVTFGTVQTSGGDGDSDPTTGNGSETTTTPNTTFAPLRSGGRRYMGEVGAGGATASVTQDFIVNGAAKSGIYNLPITLRYLEADGTASQELMYATLLVVAPPRLRVTEQIPVPESINTGEPFSLALEMVNTSDTAVNLTAARVEGENIEVLDSADIPLSPLKPDEDSVINATLMALSDGPVEVTVTLFYLDDLSREQTLAYAYSSTAMAPPPPEPLPPEPEPVVVEDQNGSDWFGRILLGLLGLGS